MICLMRMLGIVWAIVGVSALLLKAIVNLAPRGWTALQMDLTALQWVLLLGFALFMIVAEGYRGFQKKFSPRTAARVRFLGKNPTGLRVLLAPLFAMGFFDANKKTFLVAWILTGMIITLILLVSLLPQPWRGIIDVGVVLGLSWGLVSFWIFCVQALTRKDFPYSPEMP